LYESQRAGIGSKQKVKVSERYLEFASLAPLGERVDRSRRFHQPGRDGPSPAEGIQENENGLGLRPAGG
jgi:hypothetical protein